MVLGFHSDPPSARPSFGDRFRSTSSFTVAQRNFDFFCSPSSVGQRLRDVFGFKVGTLAKSLIPRPPRGYEADHGANRHTHAPDTRLPAHYAGFTSDARQLCQVDRLLGS
jgi:hypothetical protein